MSKLLMLQVCASIGALVGVALVYVGLTQDSQVLAGIAFVVFAGSLLLTPLLRVLPSRVSEDVADQT